jgi:Na+/melibiose symporter-like transporter
MIVLVLPTLGFATGLSLVTTYLPVILDRYTDSSTLIGFAIGGEGIFSALIPLWVGVVSDRIWTKRWGRRQPFMIFAAPFMAASLMLAPFQPAYVPIAISTFVFFGAYHFYTSPYQSLVADVTPADSAGKVQGYQAFMRGGGMFLGMVVAGFLFYRWEPLPFILCSLLIMVFTYLTVVKIRAGTGEALPAAAAEPLGNSRGSGTRPNSTRASSASWWLPFSGSPPWQACVPSSCCTSSTPSAPTRRPALSCSGWW